MPLLAEDSAAWELKGLVGNGCSIVRPGWVLYDRLKARAS